MPRHHGARRARITSARTVRQRLKRLRKLDRRRNRRK